MKLLMRRWKGETHGHSSWRYSVVKPHRRGRREEDIKGATVKRHVDSVLWIRRLRAWWCVRKEISNRSQSCVFRARVSLDKFGAAEVQMWPLTKGHVTPLYFKDEANEAKGPLFQPLTLFATLSTSDERGGKLFPWVVNEILCSACW